MSVFVAVTYTCNVALAFELVASTRNCWLPLAYSATWTATVSATGGVGVRVGVGGGVVGVAVASPLAGCMVSVAVFVTPAPLTETVTKVCVVTGMVEMLKPPVVDPAGIVTPLLQVATEGL